MNNDPIKVEDALAKSHSTPAPDPIPVSDQYVAAFGDDDEGDLDPHDAGHVGKTVLGLLKGRGVIQAEVASNPKGRFTFKRASDTSKCPENSRDAGEIAGQYTPHLYAEKRKIFLGSAKLKGLSYKDANASWNSSKERALLLCDVPLPELKRRRFVSKSCTQNPFQVAAGGG